MTNITYYRSNTALLLLEDRRHTEAKQSYNELKQQADDKHCICHRSKQEEHMENAEFLN